VWWLTVSRGRIAMPPWPDRDAARPGGRAGRADRAAGRAGRPGGRAGRKSLAYPI